MSPVRKKGPCAAAGYVGLERMVGLLRQLPVSLCDAGTRDPNLTNLIGTAWFQRDWIDDQDLLVDDGPATTHQAYGTRIALRNGQDAVLLERFTGDADCFRFCWPLAAGDEQRAFRHPKTGVERRFSKATRLEGLREALQRLRWIGSAPQKARNQWLKSRLSICSGLTLSTHKS